MQNVDFIFACQISNRDWTPIWQLTIQSPLISILGAKSQTENGPPFGSSLYRGLRFQFQVPNHKQRMDLHLVVHFTEPSDFNFRCQISNREWTSIWQVTFQYSEPFDFNFRCQIWNRGCTPNPIYLTNFEKNMCRRHSLAHSNFQSCMCAAIQALDPYMIFTFLS